ncbi:MAG: PEGA domain-containing protein [Myxococcales bacterium]|nr:PEGA domain-containing protein [Myxococcales bacterium]
MALSAWARTAIVAAMVLAVSLPDVAPAQSTLGKLSISDLSDANVRGATVQVDGKVAGQAPITIELVQGEHLIVVQKAGFKVFQRTVRLRAGHTAVVAPLLIKAGGAAKSPASPAPPSARTTPKAAAPPKGPPPATRQPTTGSTRPTTGSTEPAQATRQGPAPAMPSATPPAATAQPATTTRPASQTPPAATTQPATRQPASSTPAQSAGPGQGQPADAAPASAPVLPAETRQPPVAGARRMQLSRGARVLNRGTVVLDLGVGYPHYLHAQATAGLIDTLGLAIDGSVWARSRFALSEGGIRLRMQLAGGQQFSAAAIGAIGGGGGMGGRDSFNASVGVGAVMVLGERVALGARATLDIWSERLCPEPGSESDGDGTSVCQGEGNVALAKELHTDNLTDRDTSFGLTLAVTLEIAIREHTQLFVVADMAPGQTERPGFSAVFNSALLMKRDPGYGGRAGFSWVF